jgi:hypothetical protein
MLLGNGNVFKTFFIIEVITFFTPRRIDGVMVSVLAPSVVDGWFERRSG